MQTIAAKATPSLHEWAAFFTSLSARKSGTAPFITGDTSAQRLIRHLEVRLPAPRRYTVGKQLKLFGN